MAMVLANVSRVRSTGVNAPVFRRFYPVYTVRSPRAAHLTKGIRCGSNTTVVVLMSHVMSTACEYR